MIPTGTDAISPAPHHDIYSIEDLRQLVLSLKEATDWKKPVIVKIAAVHNVAAIASGIARSGADIIAIDGYRGGTGAAPTRIRDNVGIPIELALASVDQRLRDEGIRNNISIVVGGSIRSSADVVKAVALGADAVYIATAALLSMGCHLCRSCNTGKCNWGIATQRADLVKRLNPDIAYQQQNSIMAIGSGLLWGKGLGNTDPTSVKNGKFILEPQNDFIFAVAGEEMGFVGTVTIIILLLFITIECIFIARKAKDAAGRLICCGMAALIGFQSIVNICVATGLLPNTGVTLPFVSYGLTSLWSLYIGIGLVLNVGLQPKKY